MTETNLWLIVGAAIAALVVLAMVLIIGGE